MIIKIELVTDQALALSKISVISGRDYQGEWGLDVIDCLDVGHSQLLCNMMVSNVLTAKSARNRNNGT